jgi:hypothetical protein
MTRIATALLFVIASGAFVAAQRGAEDDPDKLVAGGGSLPAGWHARLDQSFPRLDSLTFTASGVGFHATTGPAAIFYRDDRPSGDYEARATFIQLEPSAHPEAYGLFIGGSDLQSANQKYTYFLIRQDGKFLIKRRAGAQTPTLLDWSDHAAVKKGAAAGKMTNTLAIEVRADRTRFLINGAEVAAQPTAQIDAKGIAGLRINHNLNVQVDGFAIRSLK